MNQDKYLKCPECNSGNILLIKDVECFDEIFYARKCIACGHKFGSFSIKK